MFVNGIRIKIGVFGRGQRVRRWVDRGFLDCFISGLGVVECVAFKQEGVFYHKKSEGHIDHYLKN